MQHIESPPFIPQSDAEQQTKRLSTIFLLIAAISILIGIFHASSLLFVNDDAFITFRYAKNLVNGLGLVYNAVERVEGYTNFLWTLIIALGMKLGFDPVPFSTTLGICFYVCNLLLFIYLSWKFRSTGKGRYLFIPLTAIVLCVHRDFSAYATSGLETSMFTFLVSAGFALLLFADSNKRMFIAGCIFVLAMMTRPDGFLFLTASVFYLFITKEKPLKSIVYFMLPSAVIFLPYWLWRYNYYGFFFPNTFYAKSIDLPYYSQGFEYAYLYLKTYYGITLIFILGGLFTWRWIKSLDKKNLPVSVWTHLREKNNRPILLASLFCVIYTLFIIRIGGDFMHARFFIPITPLLYFIIEMLINRITHKLPNLIFSILILLTTIFRNDLYSQEISVGYVVDEAKFYTFENLKNSKKDGELIRKYTEGLPVRIAFWGAGLRFIYYADPYYAIESMAGLTDTGLAHRTLLKRGRPGHEKSAPLSYLRFKKVNFYFGPLGLPPQNQLPLNAIIFDSLLAEIIVYDNAIMSHLAKYPELKFVRIPEFIDKYFTKNQSYSIDNVKEDYVFLKSFYFAYNNDTLREQKFLSYFEEHKTDPFSIKQ
ncbi:MAG: hypothetical protein QME52_00540 [Bacteroidota bacterium]|nr:hypothetical protein [Bacteroidota bacterium]